MRFIEPHALVRYPSEWVACDGAECRSAFPACSGERQQTRFRPQFDPNPDPNWVPCRPEYRGAPRCSKCADALLYTRRHAKTKTGGQVVAGSNPVSPTCGT